MNSLKSVPQKRQLQGDEILVPFTVNFLLRDSTKESAEYDHFSATRKIHDLCACVWRAIVLLFSACACNMDHFI